MSRKKKPFRYSGVQMICPYFSREEAVAISCQAQEHGMRCRLTFASKAHKQAWAKAHCETYEYWKCPMCEMQDEEAEEQ